MIAHSQGTMIAYTRADGARVRRPRHRAVRHARLAARDHRGAGLHQGSHRASRSSPCRRTCGGGSTCAIRSIRSRSTRTSRPTTAERRGVKVENHREVQPGLAAPPALRDRLPRRWSRCVSRCARRVDTALFQPVAPVQDREGRRSRARRQRGGRTPSHSRAARGLRDHGAHARRRRSRGSTTCSARRIEGSESAKRWSRKSCIGTSR